MTFWPKVDKDSMLWLWLRDFLESSAGLNCIRLCLHVRESLKEDLYSFIWPAVLLGPGFNSISKLVKKRRNIMTSKLKSKKKLP